jgi:D-threo-aldose 1-dehydrogenase
MHGLSRSESLRLLETALDCGITYFDTARMYGFGNAEGVLGSLAPHWRDRIIIASKAGILPASRSIPLRALNRGIKLLHKAVPQLNDYVPTPAAIQPRLGIFDLPNLCKSVETSLKELRTDYLDIFLLHECTEADVTNEELLYFLQNLQRQGKIRAFGLATGIEETIKIAKAHPLLSNVLQIANSIWNMNIKRLPLRVEGLTITHSTLTSRFHELAHRLSSDDSLAKEWKSALQIDPYDKAAFAQLLLANALRLNPDGAVLFFSRNPENIKASTRVATESHITAGQIDNLNALIRNKELTLTLEGIHRDHLRVS